MVDEYMLHENDPILTKFISIPKDMQSLNCMAFMAGAVEAVLDGSGFPAHVTSHSTSTKEFPNRTTLLIKFDKSVVAREKVSSYFTLVFVMNIRDLITLYFLLYLTVVISGCTVWVNCRLLKPANLPTCALYFA